MKARFGILVTLVGGGFWACAAKTDPEPLGEGNNDPHAGGSGSGGGPSAQTGAGAGDNADTMTCGGPAPGSAGGGPTSPRGESPRGEGVQCFFMEAAPGASCPPADEVPLSALYDLIHSCGFVPEFVIEAAATNALPAACEDLLRCCASLESWSQQCVDELDGRYPSADWCEGQLDYHHSQARCEGITTARVSEAGVDGGGDAGDAADAGASQGPAHVQCCYQVCGYRSCI